MKRKDIFILAYIVFIFLSAIIRQFIDFPMWNKIVVAVTAVSWMIALSDGLLEISSLSKSTADLIPTVEEQKKKANRLLVAFDCDPASADITKDTLKNTLKRYDAIKKEMVTLAKHEKPSAIASIVFYFVSFLLFMCILCFEPLYDRFSRNQEFLTVAGFGLILLVQFGIDFWSNSIKKIQPILNSLDRDLSELLYTHHTIEEKEQKHAD